MPDFQKGFTLTENLSQLMDIQWGNTLDNGDSLYAVATPENWFGGAISSQSFGYGTFTFVARTDGTQVGPYICLWDDNYENTGVELDVFENSFDENAGSFALTHWDDAQSPWNDTYSMEWYPESHKPYEWHEYKVEWSPPSDVYENGAIWYFLDGVPIYGELEHVPVDYAHGGPSNMKISWGNKVWPAAEAQQDGLNILDVSSVSYDPWY